MKSEQTKSIEMETKLVPTIGLEIHAELSTDSKMFCSCKNDPDEEKPNVNICPICLAHPGTLPVLNMNAIRHVLKMGLAVNGILADFTEWDRKNYFYPDIPKGYQISQFKYPLVSGGELSSIAIERIHLEEDTAQSTHDIDKKSLVNFNRAGVPLMELVTKPVIHEAKTAVQFAKELQLLLRYLGAGEANMEKGEMRVEANISVASENDTKDGKFGTKTEVKNLNSFKVVEKAIAYEIERQTTLLREGSRIIQETRGWDENTGETYSQRSKENSHDYRYFPDPDIPKLKLSEITELSKQTLEKELPELPSQKRERYIREFNVTEKELAVFIESPMIADYFESIVANFRGDQKKIKLTINYLLTDYLGLIRKSIDSTKDNKADFGSAIETIAEKQFVELIEMAANGDISSRGAKDLLALLILNTDFATDVRMMAEKEGLIQKSNASDLVPAIEKILADNAGVVSEYKAGKVSSLQFLIGQAMKATKGSANPEVVKKLFIERLN